MSTKNALFSGFLAVIIYYFDYIFGFEYGSIGQLDVDYQLDLADL